MNKKWQTIIQLVIGLSLLLSVGYFVLKNPDLTGMQYLMLRAIFSLAVVLVLSLFIPAKLNIDLTTTKGIVIHAGGWIAVFLILHFYNPPSPPSPSYDPNGSTTIQGDGNTVIQGNGNTVIREDNTVIRESNKSFISKLKEDPVYITECQKQKILEEQMRSLQEQLYEKNDLEISLKDFNEHAKR
jgi:hypothetical protein